MTDPDRISGYHAHVYYDDDSRAVAARLREDMSARFRVDMGRWHDKPVGPHPQSMYQVAFDNDEFPLIVPWLMMSRDGLSVLVHPNTGDDVADHSAYAMWLGEPLPLDLDFLARIAAKESVST
jgi:DOPA 4,5-dioxygenase